MSEAPSEAFGPYLVYEQLGMGGMARVDRAEKSGIEGFQQQIALKRMLPHVASNEDMVKAFVREARLASHLRHANVAQTYELGKVDDIYFIAMELITGHTLRAVLKHCASTTGPMPVPIALNILNQICDALDYAHNLCDETGQPLGIIHRDVSPSNIIVAEGGVVKLIDFGIAKASAAGMQTMSGTIKGKFGYMAPEYIAGRIDARADLFALGVIAHELLTNRPLFSGPDDMQTLQRVRSMPLLPPSRRNPNVPSEIDDIVMTALARDPDRRWQHATALRSALTTVTKRLGLVTHNRQVVEWISWAFEQTKPHGTSLRKDPRAATDREAGDTDQSDAGDSASRSDSDSDSEPSISLEEPVTQASMPPQHHYSPGAGAFGAPPPLGAPPSFATSSAASASAASSQKLTLLSDPAALAGEEYRAAVAAYSRHDELVPTASLRPEDIATTLVRAPAPLRARGSQEPANRPRVQMTLLDGAAAIRTRSESQRLAVPAAAPHGSVPPVASAFGFPPAGAPAMMAPMPATPMLSSQPMPPVGAPQLPFGAPADASAEPPRSAVMVVVLVLLAAALAAVGVYLLLPHLT